MMDATNFFFVEGKDFDFCVVDFWTYSVINLCLRRS